MREQPKLWDSQREGEKRERGKKRERENFPMKSSKAEPGPLMEQRIERIAEES